jgi:hypothetical protein
MDIRRIAFVAVGSVVLFGILGCGREELPPRLVTPSAEPFRVDDALPAEGFVAGWKAVPGSYIYAASEDELWKIYNGAAPGVINQGGREAVTQGYESTEGGADRSFRVFILRLVDRARAEAYLEKEIEGASGGEKLGGAEAGQIFDKGKAPWARFVVGFSFVSINWEGSDDDTANTALEAVGAIAAKLAGGL